jgi:D-glycero-alpha-D-manno-heptose-7-phosphate kinase
MIITRTPYRVSLFGGGTDHPSWYESNKGLVISFAIDKYCYINVRELPPFFKHNYRVSYSKVEIASELNEIIHPAVREGFREYAPELSLELHHHGDLPSQSGVGSSSAFAVGLVHSLKALQQLPINEIQLAKDAINLEQNLLAENVGSQDQIACAIGGINRIDFGPTNSWKVTPLNMSSSFKDELESHMVLLYSGVSRMSSEISSELLRDLNQKTSFMEQTYDLAEKCYEILKDESGLSEIGPMLLQSWDLKRLMNPQAVTAELDAILEKAMRSGATGGKILGAGGGGFCLFWVEPDAKEHFLQEMRPLVHVPFKITFEGTSRIL